MSLGESWQLPGESCEQAASSTVYSILCLVSCDCKDVFDITCAVSVITSRNGVARVMLVCFGLSEVQMRDI